MKYVESTYLAQYSMTAPYFHNGAAKTLDEAVTVMAKMQLDKELSKEQIADIVAFLNSLTGEFPKQTMPVCQPHPVKRLINYAVETRFIASLLLLDKKR